jgi:hypothetical protein
MPPLTEREIMAAQLDLLIALCQSFQNAPRFELPPKIKRPEVVPKQSTTPRAA